MNKLFATLSLSFLILSCSPPATMEYAQTFKEKTSSTDNNADTVMLGKVDLLFVVDTSGSMSVHQTRLSTNISAFTKAFTSGQGIDYHIGVITTDDGLSFGSAHGTLCCGKLVGNTRVVTAQTPNVNAVLANNVMVGINGATDERVFDPIMMALEPSMLANGGWNAGFSRSDATLVLIFITDAEDQSIRHTGDDVYNFIMNMKGGDKSKLLAYGVIVPVNDTTRCDRDDPSMVPRDIEKFLGKVVNAGTNIMSLCDANYGTKLAGLANDISRRASNTIMLKYRPEVKSIRVEYGSYLLPADARTGWSYDVQRNSIVIGEDFDWNAQPWGTSFKVFYNAITNPSRGN